MSATPPPSARRAPSPSSAPPPSSPSQLPACEPYADLSHVAAAQSRERLLSVIGTCSRVRAAVASRPTNALSRPRPPRPPACRGAAKRERLAPHPAPARATAQPRRRQEAAGAAAQPGRAATHGQGRAGAPASRAHQLNAPPRVPSAHCARARAHVAPHARAA